MAFRQIAEYRRMADPPAQSAARLVRQLVHQPQNCAIILSQYYDRHLPYLDPLWCIKLASNLFG